MSQEGRDITNTLMLLLNCLFLHRTTKLFLESLILGPALLTLLKYIFLHVFAFSLCPLNLPKVWEWSLHPQLWLKPILSAASLLSELLPISSPKPGASGHVRSLVFSKN